MASVFGVPLLTGVRLRVVPNTASDLLSSKPKADVSKLSVVTALKGKLRDELAAGLS